MIRAREQLVPLIEANNQSFAIRVDYHYYLTKDRSKADSAFYFDKDAPEGARVIKELKDPNDTHKYSAKKLCEEVNKRLLRLGVTLLSKDSAPSSFNTYHLDLFNKYYGLKWNPKFCYTYRVNTTPYYSYSIQAIDFIVDEIKKDPEHIIQNLRDRVKK